MKILPEHYNVLKVEVKKVLEKYPTILDEYKKSGLSEMRTRWDIFHLCPLHTCDSRNAQNNSTKLVRYAGSNEIVTIKLIDWPVYDYMNDNHIDSALKHVLKSLQ